MQSLAFEPEHVLADIAQFADAGQYVFISSASAYEKPPSHYLIAEDRTPTLNPFWSYSRGKIACEQELWLAHAEREFPMTIVRLLLTYGLPQSRTASAAGRSRSRSWRACAGARRSSCPATAPACGC